MKKLLPKIVLFLLLCFIIDRGVGYLLEKNARFRYRDRRVEKILNDSIEADIICLGSSRTAFNLRPIHISAETGLSSYNLGYPGSNVEFHKDILKLVTRLSHQPKYIILNIDEPLVFKDFEGYVYQSEFLMPYIYDDQINKMLTSRSERKYWVTLVSKTYRQNHNFYNFIKYVFKGVEDLQSTTNFDSTGSLYFLPDHPFSTKEKQSKVKAYEKADESAVKLAAYKTIQDICSENNYELICIIPPTLNANFAGFKERVEEMTTYKKASVLDFRDIFTDQTYFQDSGHLSTIGADEFSKILGKKLDELIKSGKNR